LGFAVAILQMKIQPGEHKDFAPRIRTGDLIQSKFGLNILPQKELSIIQKILALASKIAVDNQSCFLYLNVNFFADMVFPHVGLYLKPINNSHFGVTVSKLGASPQLEWWNAGILEKWVLGNCNIGQMAKFILTLKFKMDNFL
jgi:hypothetical protein